MEDAALQDRDGRGSGHRSVEVPSAGAESVGAGSAGAGGAGAGVGGLVSRPSDSYRIRPALNSLSSRGGHWLKRAFNGEPRGRSWEPNVRRSAFRIGEIAAPGTTDDLETATRAAAVSATAQLPTADVGVGVRAGLVALRLRGPAWRLLYGHSACRKAIKSIYRGIDGGYSSHRGGYTPKSSLPKDAAHERHR